MKKSHKNSIVAVAVLATFCLVALTGSALAAGPAPVTLGAAGNFAILSKSGVTDVPRSSVTGNVGASPITGAAIGLTCAEVKGKMYEVDAAGPPCAVTNATLLTTAVSDMQTAYTNAAGRPPTVTELGAGNIGGLTLTAGVYKCYAPAVYGGVNDVNGQPLSAGFEQGPATSAAPSYTPDFSGSPYLVIEDGAMLVDLPTGERRSVPSCAAQKAARDPDGRPRTVFYQPGDSGVMLREGQRGRVQGTPPAGVAACYGIDTLGRIALLY